MENTEYEEFLVQNENQMSAALKELIFDRFKFQMLHNFKHSIQVPLNPAFLRYIFMRTEIIRMQQRSIPLVNHLV